jgi:predicted permease
LAVRRAIGASRRQIVGAVMREVLVLAAAGTIGGLLLAVGATRVLATTLATVPRIAELTIDWRALAFTISVSTLSAVLFGLWPALQATRGTLRPLIAQGGRGSAGGAHRLQRVLVGAQIALTVLLVASAGLLLRTYYNLSHVSPGFDPSHTLTFHVGAQWDEDRARIGQMQVALIQRLEQTPGVTAAGLTNFLPATGATLRYQFQIQGLTQPGESGVNAGERTVSAGYLRALRVPLEAGAWCPDLKFDFNAPRTAMVNRRFADLYGQGQSLVGRTIRFADVPGSPVTITGVVGTAIEDGVGAEPFPYVYACESAGTWPDPEYTVRAAGDPARLVPVVRRIVHELAPDRAIFGMQTLETVLDQALDRPRLDTRLLSLFAAAAMLLASLGLYTLLMLLVAERTREIGVRMALGATPLMVVKLVFATAGRLVVIGVGVGLVATIAATRVMGSLVYQVSPLDVPTLAGAVLVLAIVAVAAAAIPARRAARVDPIEAMRAGE